MDRAIGGYVLAGGRSSRMGTDKSLLEFAGKTLVGCAVDKLAGVCADVRILSSDPALAGYAPLVADIHPNCGPIGGIEAGLHDSAHEWNIFLSVDMPLLPVELIRSCADQWLQEESRARIRIFTAEGRPQPGFCMLHTEVERSLAESICRGDYKLMRAFDLAAKNLGEAYGVGAREVMRSYPIEEWSFAASDLTLENRDRDAQAARMWFANLNTLEEFVEAKKYLAITRE